LADRVESGGNASRTGRSAMREHEQQPLSGERELWHEKRSSNIQTESGAIQGFYNRVIYDLRVPMTEVDPVALSSAIELIAALKPLFSEKDPYLPVYSALGGAFVGALASFVPNYFLEGIKEARVKKATTLQLYAEIKATMEVVQHRGYIRHLEEIEHAMLVGTLAGYRYQVIVPDERNPIYKCALERLGVLDIDIQAMVVEFYQLLEAITQDVKPGGLLNSTEAGLPAYQEALKIAWRTHRLGEVILTTIGKRYRLPAIVVES
jgi:hypothetical protein